MHKIATKIFTRYPRRSITLLEKIPPLFAIFLISMPFWGAVFFPIQLAYFIIFFDVYWLYKSANLAVCAFLASKKIKIAEKTNWVEKSSVLENYSKVHHLVIIPTYQESISKIKETIDSIAHQTFPAKKIFIFVAFEEREVEAKEKSQKLSDEYGHIFAGFYSTFHPDIPSEVKGKSSNQAFAGHAANKFLIEEGRVDINYLTVTSADADAIFDKQFFACLTYSFLTSKTPHLAFWQSANVSYNNFWKVPSFIRIISFFGSLWRIALLVQGLRLIPNSVYSLSFKLLKDIDYWDTDVIPEDYRIFFKAFFRSQGKVTVEPILLKTSMDAPRSPTYFKSLMNKYNQERRWSWGISDDAVYLKWWILAHDAPFFKKTYLVANVILDHILWPVNWYIITISANLIVFLNPVFTRTSLGYSLPQMSGFILTLCLFALFVLIYVDFDMRSGSPREVSRFRQFIFPLEFVLMPISGFFLSSLPALISHVQLILGKRLEYHVTEKS
ncbi:MAG TPA: glycosyltransferase family 2 protein [Patescibacteria group bacterium]|nr:glycosyltransferase family 2 protein [Patescibacteria group bacterium]